MVDVELIRKINEFIAGPKKDYIEPNTVQHECMSNVVEDKTLKKTQLKTLEKLSTYLSKTYGPMGSYTAIISGSGPQDILTTYSKDGLKVLKHILFDSPIELAIQAELSEICRYVESKVGDGTTSAVLLSTQIYKGLMEAFDNDLPPRKIVKEFNNTVDIMKKLIEGSMRSLTLEDVYNICMISTNGNTVISKQIESLYGKYGFNINIDVSISNDEDTKVKTYDGLVIEEGYSDPAYINNVAAGTCDIRNANVYCFQDPVDTPEMISFFERILLDNIFTPIQERKLDDMKPTVIICPMISRDGNGLLTKLIESLHELDQSDAANHKPPVLILTNIHGTDEEIALDVARLCNCKYIRKYINPDVQKHEIETGEAPTLDTIHRFAGTCELVSADMQKTKFVNPYDSLENENKIYDSLVGFLSSELDNAIKNNSDHLTIGRLRKRLRCLESNLIEFLVGGISISDRDALKDLVEDAVKNVASAAENGVGRAANFEGLMAAYKLLSNYDIMESDNRDKIIRSVDFKISAIIFNAYYNAAKVLYSSVLPATEVDQAIMLSIGNEMPYNVMDLFEHGLVSKPGTNVSCSIRTDIEILDAISKIITMMVTSNQCLLQTTTLNTY